MNKYYKIEINYPTKNNTWEGWKDYFNYESRYYDLEQAKKVLEQLRYHFETYAVFDKPELRIVEYTTRIIRG